MAVKSSSITPKQNYPKEPIIKFVRKAGMWVMTTFETDSKGNVKQIQKWSVSRGEL